MNVKFGLMAGAAIACAVMAGCKAPKARTSGGATVEPTRPVPQRTEIVTVDPTRPAPQRTEIVTVEEAPAPKAAKPVPFTKAPKAPPRCTCVPGTVHEKPCACGAPNCKCKVAAPEPEYTLYRVKSGDMLSAICKTYGVRQKKVLELNPGLDPNKLYAGRKIKLPGKVELLGDDVANAASQPAATGKPAPKAGKAAPAAKAPARASTYNGATKEYKVQSGDSLGKIAVENGITIKCLKEMNGLKNNNIRIGQKLKVPAEKPVAAEVKPAETAKPAEASAPAEAPAAPKAAAKPAEAPAAPAEPVAAAPEEPSVMATPAVEQVKDTSAALEAVEAKTHTVKENEDIVSIAIQYGVSPSALMDLNDLKNTDPLPPGRVLKLPANAKMP